MFVVKSIHIQINSQVMDLSMDVPVLACNVYTISGYFITKRMKG